MSGLLKGSDRYAGPRPLHYPVVGDLLFCFGLTQCDIALNLDTVPIRQGQPGQPDQKTRRGHRGATARETLTRPWRQLLAGSGGSWQRRLSCDWRQERLAVARQSQVHADHDRARMRIRNATAQVNDDGPLRSIRRTLTPGLEQPESETPVGYQSAPECSDRVERTRQPPYPVQPG